MQTEQIVPAGQINELLGVKVAPRQAGINIPRLNITDPANPGFGRWIKRDETIRWMEMCLAHSGGNAVLERMIDELKEITSA